jgi:hypothetical protein
MNDHSVRQERRNNLSLIPLPSGHTAHGPSFTVMMANDGDPERQSNQRK